MSDTPRPTPGPWRKYPSVTSGGKPFFYRLYDADGQWLASVIWNRGVHAYGVEVLTVLENGVRTGRLVEYASTIPGGKRIAVTALAKAEGRPTNDR